MRKLICLAALSAVTFIFASPAKADATSPTDPVMLPKGGNAGDCGSTTVSSDELFSIGLVDGSSVPGSDEDCFFYEGATPIASLTVTGTIPMSVLTADGDPCDGNDNYTFVGSGQIFNSASCRFNPDTDVLTVTFSGTNADRRGIQPDSDFYMDLSGWDCITNPDAFSGNLQPVPEPGSLALFVSGLVGLRVVRRWNLALGRSKK